VKLSNDGKVFVRLSSTPPPRSRLSWSLFKGPAQCTWSRHMTPWLYLHLDLLIERRYMDNPPRHSCLLVVYFFCLKLGLPGCFLPLLLVIVRDGRLLFCRITWGWLHTRGAIVWPGVDFFFFLFLVFWLHKLVFHKPFCS
jgi:hypothetical protein